jgi:hypothetical protein
VLVCDTPDALKRSVGAETMVKVHLDGDVSEAAAALEKPRAWGASSEATAT